MKILVTGGAGFIGSNLANALIDEIGPKREHPVEQHPTSQEEENYAGAPESINYGEVIALDDLSLGSPSNVSNRVTFVNGSVMNYDLVLELSKGCDYIFHQAALSSSPMFVDDPRRGVDVNVMGFMNIMESAKRNRVKKVIYASSSSLYNGLPTPYKESDSINPKTFYESSFYCREMIARTYCLEYGLSSIGLRYFSVYGPNEKHKGRFANNISQFIWDIAERRKSPLIYGDGSQTRDFTFVEDVVHANILAMRKKQHKRSANNIDDRGYELPEYSIYNVGTGIQTSFNHVVDLINKQLGTNIMPTYVENPINNYVRHTMADISLARSELGYEPKWPDVENGIKQLLSLQQSANPSSSSGSSYLSIRI